MWLFSFRRYCQTVCRTKWLFQLTSPSARFESFPQSPSSHHFTWSSFPFSPSNVKRHCVVVLICISLVTKEVEHHFIYYWLFRNFLFVKWLFKSLLSFFYCFFLLICGSFSVFWKYILCHIYSCPRSCQSSAGLCFSGGRDQQCSLRERGCRISVYLCLCRFSSLDCSSPYSFTRSLMRFIWNKYSTYKRLQK